MEKENNICSRGNCPFYDSVIPASWGLSPEGWDRARENHRKNH